MKGISAAGVILFCLTIAGVVLPQEFYPAPGNGVVTGGLGYALIDDTSFVSITFRPEIAIGKIGIGLNLELLYNLETGEIRTEDWNETYDYFRILRYIRYGHKRDPIYARVGAFDRARIGHGLLMNYYTNETANYDKRKIGLAFDLDRGTWGFESMTSNLGRLEIVGGRFYTRPLRYVTDIPIIKNLTFGASYIADIDPDENRNTDDVVSTWGLDSELPLLNIPIFYTGLFYDVGHINNYGSGQAFGIEAQLEAIANLFHLYAKFERRLLGKEFVPTFFGPYYEIERYRPKGYEIPYPAGTIQDSTVTHKAELLAVHPKYQNETKGWYGELGGHVLGAIQIIGTYQWLDDVKHSGLLHAQADIPDTVPKIVLRATYDKDGIETIKDLSLIGSVAKIGIGYKLNPWLLVNMDYIYTWYQADDGSIKTQKRIQPGISFVYHFPVGGK